MPPAMGSQEIVVLERFKTQNPDLFEKNDGRLLTHLGIVIALLVVLTAVVVTTPHLWIKIVLGAFNSLLWFSLINVTIHHHLTHHNTTSNEFLKGLLNVIYFISVPNAPKRRNRYIRAHLNHHARPFHETDVDHHYGTDHYLKMMRKLSTRILYYLELSFVGAHVPGWEDDSYMNRVPLEEWNQKDYLKVKEVERRKAWKVAAFQWTLFFVALWIVPPIAWGWGYPMLLVKNWAHFLGQFQHYDQRLLDPARSIWRKTKTYHFPAFLNYLAGGEISGHFLHHLYPEIPYYNIERARQRLVNDPELASIFALY